MNEDIITFLTKEREKVQAQFDGVLLLLSIAERSCNDRSAWKKEAWERRHEKIAFIRVEHKRLILILEHIDGTLTYLQNNETENG